MQFTTFILAALTSASAISARSVQPQRRSTVTAGLPNPAFSISKDLATGTNVGSVQAFPVDLPATECTLFWKFLPGFYVGQQGASQINVYAVDGPAAGSLVGTFSIGVQDGLPHDINTFQCRDPLTVRFEIASDSQPGSVSFQANDQNGIFLEYTK